MRFILYSSRRLHTRCALVTGVQTCALPVCCHGHIPERPFRPSLPLLPSVPAVPAVVAGGRRAVRRIPPFSAAIDRMIDRMIDRLPGPLHAPAMYMEPDALPAAGDPLVLLLLALLLDAVLGDMPALFRLGPHPVGLPGGRIRLRGRPPNRAERGGRAGGFRLFRLRLTG